MKRTWGTFNFTFYPFSLKLVWIPIIDAIYYISYTHKSLIYLMLVPRVGFYVRISEPRIGGTHTTLLSILENLGVSVTSSIVLYVAE
ncbi:unnamed protein product [Adineta steineri]|uniref:Uncharacterized protein n=1 Tax=Adineta steineri TaxID=433720 RepID=A0A815CQT5_9BILA|nr:unnamed protein product [Adineta steineri]CAF1482179.1 unnamed protein product [Adineta steineri]CAF3642821.1 unnamed protein product [Adineta steineri]CAF3764652.1 unnamed protein product [Adineta steineri]